jgi:hypothetical protein
MINRRGLITGLVSFIAAPAIVRAASLMPVKSLPIPFRVYDNAWVREQMFDSVVQNYPGGFSVKITTTFLYKTDGSIEAIHHK